MLPDPALRPGSVIVRIDATFTSHFISKIVDGSGGYLTPQRPFTPGMDAIGTVERVSRRSPRAYRRATESTAIRFTSLATRAGPASACSSATSPPAERFHCPLLAEWPDGAYAEKICLPADCVIPIHPGVTTPAAILCRIGWLGTAYGAFRKVKPGAGIGRRGQRGDRPPRLERRGRCASLSARARSSPSADGRAALEAVAAIDPRVEPRDGLAAASPMVDVALSSVDGADSASLEALLPRVRRKGAFVLVGAPATPLAINAAWLMRNDVTIRGSLWFDKAHAAEMFALIAAGAMDLTHVHAEIYPLSEVNEAIAAAHHRPNPLHHVAVSCA